VTTQASCTGTSSWQGADTVCNPNPCPPPTITLSPTTLPNGTLNVAYSQTVTASGGTASYSFAVTSGSLPTGLSLAGGGGISGTPSAGGTYNFTITATDANSFTGSRAYSVTISASSLDLTVSVVYITQSSQTQAFDVPLVQDRDGLLRAFVLANQANSATPDVRVRIYNGASLVQTYTITAPGSSVPTSITEGTLSSSWNQLIPGNLIQTGYKLLVDVDPSGAISETNDSNNSWPVSGVAQTLTVHDVPIFDMTLVPVHNSVGTGGVTGGNASSYMDYTRRMHPMPDYNAQVHATMNTNTTLQSNGTGWDTVLDEVTAQRTTDGSSRYYYGVVKVSYGSGVAGLGWIGYPVAIGWDYLPSASLVMAHELGHNWARYHVACSGGESGTDGAYPYGGGIIGAYGYDLWASTQKDKTTYKDVMSYCSNQWVSDYTYKAVMNYRESSGIGFQAQGSENGAPEPCLLVWGLRRNGQILLEPSFHVNTRPSIPEPGPFRVEGLDANGTPVWSQSFDLMEITHMPDPTAAGFCFAAPMSAELNDQIVTLRVVEWGQERARHDAPKLGFRQSAVQSTLARAGDGIDFAWDASASPVVMIRDLDHGTCLGFARGGSKRIETDASRIELRYSDGVHTRVQVWPMQ